MYYSISIALLLAIASTAQIKTIPISSKRGEFEDATVIKDSKNYRIESRTKDVTILNVPDVYQATDYTCGPSSLTAVLSYYGKQDYRQMDLAKLAQTTEDEGTMPEKLHRSIQSLGFNAEIRQNMTIDALQQYIGMRRPVIVLIQAWKDDEDPVPYPDNFENGHYVVAIGYDALNIYFQDPWKHGSLTYMRKADLFDRWHGNTDQPTDRRIYRSGIIVNEPLVDSNNVIYLQ